MEICEAFASCFITAITLIKPIAYKFHLLYVCVLYSGPQWVPQHRVLGLIKQNVIVKYFTAKRKQTYKIYS